MRFFSQVAALCLLTGGAALHADTFRYDLDFDLPGVASASATFTSSALITTDTTVAATGTSSSGPVLRVGIFVPGDCPFGSLEACFAITEASDGQRLFLDSLPTSTGTFTDFFGNGTVTVTDISGTVTPSPIPEPSSFALLGTGMLGGLGAIRRRLA